MKRINIIISGLLPLLILINQVTFSGRAENSLRRIRSAGKEREERIVIPEEYKGVVRKLDADDENIRLEGIEEIVSIVTEKESDKNKRKALALALYDKFSDRREIVRERVAMALRSILPSYDQEFQILVGLKIVEKLGNPEEYVRGSAVWGLKKIMPSLEMAPRRMVALQIIDRWLYSPLRYASFSSMVTLGKIIDYLNYDSQKAVVEKLQEKLASDEKGEITVKTLIWITPSLKAKVIEDLGMDLRDYLKEKSPKTTNRDWIVTIRIIVDTISPYLQDHNALKEELESEMSRLINQP